MSTVRKSVEIAAPIERVWAFTTDPGNLEQWVTIHRELRAHSPPPIRKGSTIDQQLALAGAPFRVRWEVADLAPPHRVVWDGRGPAHSRATIEYKLTELPAGRTRFDYENEFKPPGGALGMVAGRVLMGGITERQAERTLKRLKELLEGE